MPRIPEYKSQVGASADIPIRGARASDFGGTGISELGQGIQQAGVRVGETARILHQRQVANEITSTDVRLLQTHAELSNELQEMVKNWKPEDGEIIPAFQEKVRQRMEGAAFREDGTSVHDTPEGRRHFEASSARMSSSFLMQAAQAQSHVMGQQVIVEHNKAVDVAANLAQTNPDAFDVFKEQLEAMIDNPNGRYSALPAVKRQELKNASVAAVARGAVEGKIRSEPRVALDKLGAGWMTEYLKDNEYSALIAHAKTAVHALDVDEDRAYRDSERKRVAEARATTNKLLTIMAAHDADPTNPPLTAQNIIDSGLGALDDNGMQSLIGIVHARSKEGAEGFHTDPGTYRDLFNRIHAKPGDPKRLTSEIEIQDAFGKRQKLKPADMAFLRKEFQDRRTEEGARLGDKKKQFFDNIKTQITKSNILMGKLDTDGDLQMLRYMQEVESRIEKARKAGKDEHELFNPKSPEYVGAPGVLQDFQKTQAESLQSFSEKLRREKEKAGPLPPELLRKEGESYADWLKRRNSK